MIGDDREESEEVAEGGDDLRVPEAAHGDEAEHGAHAESDSEVRGPVMGAGTGMASTVSASSSSSSWLRDSWLMAWFQIQMQRGTGKDAEMCTCDSRNGKPLLIVAGELQRSCGLMSVSWVREY